MIMPRGQQLLMPVNPLFIATSLALALAWHLLPLGPVAWMPDVLMLLLAFWGVHQPARIGMGLGFVLGLAVDVSQSALLGQHALAYTGVLLGTHYGHRRMRWFSAPAQALQMLGLFTAAHAVQVLVGWLSGGLWPGWTVLGAPLAEALLWPLASWVLLAPQRRPPDRDENRPL